MYPGRFPLRADDSRRWRRYRITLAEYLCLLGRQGGGCDICGDLDPTPGDDRAHAVDHDHSCCPGEDAIDRRRVRGILCRNRNTMIGRPEDGPAKLLRETAIRRKAAEYPMRDQRPFSNDDAAYEGDW
ncbi:endonuclease domain-containing protein [Actinomadura kijaniata]|uniref:endonuclease domain-containing protein n=1 Tax=Actinomadura kijaniata TaxID=46161 RepID=UPI003F1C0F9C